MRIPARLRAEVASQARSSPPHPAGRAGSGHTGHRHPAHPDRDPDRTVPPAAGPSESGTGGRAARATPRLKICWTVLLESSIQRVDGRLHGDRLVDDRDGAGVTLGRLGKLLVKRAGGRQVDRQFLLVEWEIQHAREATPVFDHVLV